MYEAMEFGTLVRALREMQGLSQEAVDQRGGPSRQVIGDVENGRELAPSGATLRKLDEGLGLPDGLLRSILICSAGPTSEYFDRARVHGVSPEHLALHCDSGEEMEWPDTLLVGDFDGLQDRLLDAGQSMLINVDAFPGGDAEAGAGYQFIRQWAERYGAWEAVRSTTLRAGMLCDRGVVDALPAIESLQEARTLLEALQSPADSRYPLVDVQEAALAALFVAYVAFSADVSAFDVLDRIQLRGPALFPTIGACQERQLLHAQTDADTDDVSGEAALDGRIITLWVHFRNAIGLAADYGQRPDIKSLYDMLGEALRQRREIVNVTLPSGGAGMPARSDVTVWPLRDVVRTRPGILLYDGRRFSSLPALWQWSWESNNPGAYYWHVTSDADTRATGRRGAKVVSVGADIDELIGQRFADLARGEAVLSHRRGFEGGWLAVLTLAKSHGLESHPVLLPGAGTAS